MSGELRRVVVTLFADDIPTARRMVRRAIGPHHRRGGTLYRDRASDWWSPAGFLMFQTGAAPALVGSAELEAARMESQAPGENPMSLLAAVKEVAAAAVGIETEEARTAAKRRELRALWANGAEEQARGEVAELQRRLVDVRARMERGEVLGADGISLLAIRDQLNHQLSIASTRVQRIEAAKREHWDLIDQGHPLKTEYRLTMRERRDLVARLDVLKRDLERTKEARRRLQQQLDESQGWPEKEKAMLRQNIANEERLEQELADDFEALDAARKELDETLARCRADATRWEG